MLEYPGWPHARLIAPKTKQQSRLQAELPVPDSWRLTHTEIRVVQYLAAGLTPARIAYSFGRSVHTIRTHLKRAIAKAGVNTQVALVARLYTASDLNLGERRSYRKSR
jgi:DNA-binding CsgD family transcriptional regulator